MMSRYKRINLVFNLESDSEILEILMSKKNKTAYIKEAIRYFENLQEFKIDRMTLKEVLKEAIREVGVISKNITNEKSLEVEEGISDDILNTIMNM